MEVWVGNPEAIGGDDAVRELFTFAQHRSVHAVRALIRVKRTKSGDAPLRVSLETPSGKVLGEARVDASRVPDGAPGWVSATFRAGCPEARRAAPLVLRSDDEEFEAYPIRDGTPYGFGTGTTFPGYAQFTTGGSSTGWDQWGEDNRRDGDLQFALRLAD